MIPQLKYYYDNKEEILQKRKEYYKQNKDKINERNNNYFKIYYQKNKYNIVKKRKQIIYNIIEDDNKDNSFLIKFG